MKDEMKLLWGDLHNHCGISYGFGSLENALLRAAAHLDFCAVTGHAMWPDMYDRNEDTAFIVDFHNQGFEKLRKHWEEIRRVIAATNGQDLVTFQSYEMHSSRYGDHHLLTADDTLPLIYRDSPEELVRDSHCDAITVAHHIGYTPSYRGINWDEYDSTVTPLIEVYSKHGCAMREGAPYPYYHDMGPRDSRNTIFEGLKRGQRFGFLGSTDHHAGYPGSYGDGKAAVWVEEKSREAIWRALKERRCYAVTADRIECWLVVDGFPLGSIAEGRGGNRRIALKVTGAYPLDKITIYKNLLPLHIINGETLPGKPGKGRYKLRIEMGWGNNADEDFLWEGRLKVDGGRLQEVEPCFRGKSILSPTNRTAGEEVNGMDNRIVTETEDCLEWRCYSVRNISTQHPQTQAVILCIEGGEDTALRITVNGMTDTHTLGELTCYGYSRHVKPWHSQAFKVHPAFFETAYTAEAEFTDPAGRDGDFYHLEVSQQNGSWAFVSPVYFL